MKPTSTQFALLLLAAGLVAASASAEGNPSDEGEPVRRMMQALSDFDAAQRSRKQDPDGAKRLFLSAARQLESLADGGVINGRLEYNIGNAYLQAGDLGRAVLHYRRAERLIPNDPLLRDNLAIARSKRLTSIAATSQREFLRAVFFWHYQTTTGQRALAAAVLYVSCWVLLMIWNFRPRTSCLVGALVVLSGSAAAGASVGVDRWIDRNTPAGVILSMDVSIFKGPGPAYGRQFEQPLQPGVEFKVMERRMTGETAIGQPSKSAEFVEWWRIELPDGKSGWFDASAAELVPVTRSASLSLIAES